MQIKTRLTLQFLMAVAPIVLISFFFIYYSSAKYRRDEFYSRLEKRALTTVEFLTKEERVDSSLLKVIDRVQKDNLPKENVTVYNELNLPIYTNNDSVSFKLGTFVFKEIKQNSPVYFVQDDYEIVGLTYAYSDKRYVVIAGAVDKYGLSKLNNLRNTLFALFFIFIGLTALAGWMYSSRALKPISSVIIKAERISASNLSERLPEPMHDDEIGKLVSAFNKMLGRIENSFRIQKLFVGGASHELKNPLTVITTQLEVTLLKNRSCDEYRDTIHSVLEDIKGLNIITTQLIDFSRVSQENIDITFEKIRIDELLNDFVESFKKRNPALNLNYKIEALPLDEKYLMLNVNEGLLLTAFNNLADNACKFSPDKKVEVRLRAEKTAIEILFINNGPAIPEEDRLFIFEPFYRSKSSLAVQGHGIGLALVSKIAALHGGTVSLDDYSAGNVVFKVRFERDNINRI
jgi:signal transduction histidine kinase